MNYGNGLKKKRKNAMEVKREKINGEKGKIAENKYCEQKKKI